MGHLDHPAISRAVRELGSGLDPLITAEREEAVAVVVDDGELRRTIIVERDGDEWPLPQLLGGSRTLPAVRQPTTVAHEPFGEWSVSGSGRAGADGAPPAVVWHALSGVAAGDVVAVRVSTETDHVEVTVREDGRFLALLRGAPRAELSVEVVEQGGRHVPVSV